MSEDDSEIFALYLDFVYTGVFKTAEKSDEELAAVDLKTYLTYRTVEYHTLFWVYILADKLQDINTKDKTIGAILELGKSRHVDQMWAVSSCNLVYQNTAQGSLARALVTDLNSACKIEYILKGAKSMHDDLMHDISENLKKLRPLKGSFRGNYAVYRGLQTYLEEK